MYRHAYTHAADEGEFDLSSYAQVNKWINRVKSQKDHVSITENTKQP